MPYIYKKQFSLNGFNIFFPRCFSFGIGSGASSTLVKGIAEAGKGAAEFITTGERMQAKVSNFSQKFSKMKKNFSIYMFYPKHKLAF